MRSASRVRSLRQPFFAFLLALVVAGVFVWLTSGEPLFSPAALQKPFVVFAAMGKGAFGGTDSLLSTLAKATPLLFTGLAVAVALRAGLFNIGAEGQLMLGGLAAAWVGFALVPTVVRPDDIKDPARFLTLLRDAPDPVAQTLKKSLYTPTRSLLSSYDAARPLDPSLLATVCANLSSVLRDKDYAFYEKNRFASVSLSPELRREAETKPTGTAKIQLNRRLLEAAYPGLFAPRSLTFVPPWVHLPLALLAGALGGALWAFVPGILKAWRGAHEVIVTIMMNYIAINLTHLLLLSPLKDPFTQATKTPAVSPTARLWSLDNGTNFSAGFFLALAAAVAVWFLMRRTALGYEIRAVGLGAEAARAAGVPVGRRMVNAMLLSGALAGLAGAVEVLGIHGRFFDAFSGGLGFDSIAVALLGNLNAWGITLSAVLFGGLSNGARAMQQTVANTPKEIAGIVQAVVIVAVGARYVRRTKPPVTPQPPPRQETAQDVTPVTRGEEARP